MMMGATYSGKGFFRRGLPHLSGPAIAILIWILFVPLMAQEIIENPDKPQARDAGRVLELRDEWVITDESGAFYFKGPYNLQVAEDGSVFIADEKQLLKFSANGRFLKNIYKQGQGPGEIDGFFSYQLRGRDLVVWVPLALRFWRADQEGRLEEEIRLKDFYNDFIAVVPGGFLFLKQVHPDPKERTGKLLDIKDAIAFVDARGERIRDVFGFHHRQFFGPSYARAWDLNIQAAGRDGRFLFGYHGLDYLIEVLDQEKDKIIRRFRRPYTKIPYVESKMDADFRKKFNAPKMEFKSDIIELFVDGPRLWVRTSTEDKTKGSLFDVFDPEGRWLDSFFLGPERALMAVRDGFVYTLETMEDGTFRIHKSRIVQ